MAKLPDSRTVKGPSCAKMILTAQYLGMGKKEGVLGGLICLISLLLHSLAEASVVHANLESNKYPFVGIKVTPTTIVWTDGP